MHQFGAFMFMSNQNNKKETYKSDLLNMSPSGTRAWAQGPPRPTHSNFKDHQHLINMARGRLVCWGWEKLENVLKGKGKTGTHVGPMWVLV